MEKRLKKGLERAREEERELEARNGTGRGRKMRIECFSRNLTKREETNVRSIYRHYTYTYLPILALNTNRTGYPLKNHNALQRQRRKKKDRASPPSSTFLKFPPIPHLVPLVFTLSPLSFPPSTLLAAPSSGILANQLGGLMPVCS